MLDKNKGSARMAAYWRHGPGAAWLWASILQWWRGNGVIFGSLTASLDTATIQKNARSLQTAISVKSKGASNESVLRAR